MISIMSEPAHSFDEETYKKAKPHFVSAWNNVKDIGYSAPELINYFYDQFGYKIRPYLEQFVRDIRDGNLHNEPETIKNGITKCEDEQKQSFGKMDQEFDSEMWVDLFIIGGAQFEAGVRQYAEWSKTVLDDIGEQYEPYLRGVYEHLRHYPGLDKEGITPFEEIDPIEEEDEMKEPQMPQLRQGVGHLNFRSVFRKLLVEYDQEREKDPTLPEAMDITKPLWGNIDGCSPYVDLTMISKPSPDKIINGIEMYIAEYHCSEVWNVMDAWVGKWSAYDLWYCSLDEVIEEFENAIYSDSRPDLNNWQI